MSEIAEIIYKVLTNPDSDTVKRDVRNEVLDICEYFPVERVV